MIATFKKKGWMKLMIHTGKYLIQLLMSQQALMMETVTITGIKYMIMKRSLYSETKFYMIVRFERSRNG